MADYSSCKCFAAHYSGRRVTKIKLHSEQIDKLPRPPENIEEMTSNVIARKYKLQEED